MEDNKKFELNDEQLDNVAGGQHINDTNGPWGGTYIPQKEEEEKKGGLFGFLKRVKDGRNA